MFAPFPVDLQDGNQQNLQQNQQPQMQHANPYTNQQELHPQQLHLQQQELVSLQGGNQQENQQPQMQHANPYANQQIKQELHPPQLQLQHQDLTSLDAANNSIPRVPQPKKRIRKLPPEKRQKVSTACDTCKKRKFKCTGEKPCTLCVKKGAECTYTIIDKRSLKSERIAQLKKVQAASKIGADELMENYITTANPHSNRRHPSSNSVSSINDSSPESTGSTPPSSAASIVSLHSHSTGLTGPNSDSSPASIHSPLSSNGNTYIPKSLQPLLSFPLNDEKDFSPGPSGQGTSNGLVAHNGISNQNGKCVILLNDNSGTFRYMGETSPLSLLYETRNVFIQYVGRTPFTENLQCCPVVDKPYFVPRDFVNVPLPPRHEADLYVEMFKRNINDSYFVMDMDSFHSNYVDPVYESNGEVTPENLVQNIIVYLVLAVGALYNDYNSDTYASPVSEAFLKTGLNLLKDTVQDSEIWVVQVHYITFFYYQATIKKSTGWIHLNLAIKYAQSLGMHRNFVNEQFSYKPEEILYRKKLARSLYVSDRIASIFIGRPLTISDYDWDDPAKYQTDLGVTSGADFNTKAQIELTKISSLIGKIVGNFYRDRIIDINRTKKLAIDLKLWSINLDSQLAIENIMKPTEIPNNENHENTHILLLIHLLQLYAIMLLSRPFFMYEAVSKLSPELKKTPIKNKSLSKHFYQAAMKASILAIKLMNYYMNTTYKECMRKECYIVITCCFYGSILIGIGIVNGGYEDEDYTETDLFNCAKMAINILNHFAPTNPGAERYAVIIGEMIDALTSAKNNATQEKDQVDKMLDSELDDMDFRILNDYNFIDDPNNNLKSLIDFQQFFVPQEMAPTTGLTSANGDFSFTTMPHDYGNYELFFGDKY
ncbi:zinc finger transcription factor of the Zn(2)-Cys(6) binuclear cluster domain type [Scheffersomyces xylosifermentans]|uniref:zinc finger transcription factor of the Zn(2)-Cys(6) binuclear cluster domain type n=1 Tax=Scheffersomyces xylosifermentans TaxID=1304137 RepID=UPI00315E013F